MSRRTLTLLLAGCEALYLAWAFIFGYVNDSRLGDGLNWMPAFFATPAFLITGLPALILVAFDKAPRTALGFAMAGVLLVPLIYWQFLLGGLLFAFGL